MEEPPNVHGIEPINPSEIKLLDLGKKASSALDKVLDAATPDEKKSYRRWDEIGGFCAMLAGAKPVLDTRDNWTYGKPLLDKMIEVDPSLKFAFDTLPGYRLVNREAIVQTMNQNPDYFPDVTNYDQAKEFFIKHYNLRLDPKGMDPQEFINQVVRTGLFLGYPKQDSEKMAQHSLSGFSALSELISFTDPREVREKTGISEGDLEILRQLIDAAQEHSQGLISQNLKRADLLESQAKMILDKAHGIDPKVKQLFLARRGYMFNQVFWVGFNDSAAGVEAMERIDEQFQQTGMKDVLIKQDIVLQGHDISVYQLPQAA